MTAQVQPVKDAGEEWLPSTCPAWCEGGHAQAYAEGCGWETSRIHQTHGGEEQLPQLRNEVSQKIQRKGGGHYYLRGEEVPHGPNGGSATPELVVLEIAEGLGGPRADLLLTTGETRVLAVRLIGLCDRLDGIR